MKARSFERSIDIWGYGRQERGGEVTANCIPARKLVNCTRCRSSPTTVEKCHRHRAMLEKRKRRCSRDFRRERGAVRRSSGKFGHAKPREVGQVRLRVSRPPKLHVGAFDVSNALRQIARSRAQSRTAHRQEFPEVQHPPLHLPHTPVT